ncbi:MAG: hypothetical protein HY209_04800 [Candidatus Omnitrophica bacterium]|nr:hypothetical protein [Candidatus Omnitrophota bacterium]
MKKVLSVLIFAVLIGVGLAWAQDEGNTVDNSLVPETLNTTEDMDNQQINQDEGYGANDEEYNNSEDTNADDPAAQTNAATPTPAPEKTGY